MVSSLLVRMWVLTLISIYANAEEPDLITPLVTKVVPYLTGQGGTVDVAAAAAADLLVSVSGKKGEPGYDVVLANKAHVQTFIKGSLESVKTYYGKLDSLFSANLDPRKILEASYVLMDGVLAAFVKAIQNLNLWELTKDFIIKVLQQQNEAGAKVALKAQIDAIFAQMEKFTPESIVALSNEWLKGSLEGVASVSVNYGKSKEDFQKMLVKYTAQVKSALEDFKAGLNIRRRRLNSKDPLTKAVLSATTMVGSVIKEPVLNEIAENVAKDSLKNNWGAVTQVCNDDQVVQGAVQIVGKGLGTFCKRNKGKSAPAWSNAHFLTTSWVFVTVFLAWALH